MASRDITFFLRLKKQKLVAKVDQVLLHHSRWFQSNIFDEDQIFPQDPMFQVSIQLLLLPVLKYLIHKFQIQKELFLKSLQAAASHTSQKRVFQIQKLARDIQNQAFPILNLATKNLCRESQILREARKA